MKKAQTALLFVVLVACLSYPTLLFSHQKTQQNFNCSDVEGVDEPCVLHKVGQGWPWMYRYSTVSPLPACECSFADEFSKARLGYDVVLTAVISLVAAVGVVRLIDSQHKQS